MIIDYNNKEFAFANGVQPENIHGKTHFTGGEFCKGITFRNFYHLYIEEATFEDCIFENCHQVTADECRMGNCRFHNEDEVVGIRTDFHGCMFKDCCCSDGPFLTIDGQGNVEDCTFDTVTALGDQGYIIYSVYGKKEDVEIVSGCKFVDCRFESEDSECCYCAYFKKISSNKTVEVDNVDWDTCRFEFDEGEAIEIGSFELEIPEEGY